MKKLIFLCVALLVTPAMAMITFDGEVAGGILTIRYSSDGDLPRGVALKLTCTDAQIDGYVAASADPAFNCFIDYAFTAGDGYEIEPDIQHPLADPDNPGVVAALPATVVSVCMGVLDQTENQGAGPLEADPLFQLEVSGTGTIVVTADTLRGPGSGVVGSELESNLSDGGELSIPVDGEPPCYEGMPDYDEYVAVGKPECWCYPTQCKGDANGTKEGSPFTGYYYVGSFDLTKLIDAWKVQDISTVPDGACADFNHLEEGSPFTGYYRVGSFDLTILIANWKDQALVADCEPGNVVP